MFKKIGELVYKITPNQIECVKTSISLMKDNSCYIISNNIEKNIYFLHEDNYLPWAIFVNNIMSVMSYGVVII